jgi:hypothetical protein
MLIGVPVAFTPGLGPHDDVSVDPVLAAVVLDEELDPPLADALLALLAPPLLLLLLLLPQAATNTAASTAASTKPKRTPSVR